MQTLSYQTISQLSTDRRLLPNGTTRVLQFGEGNFLRAFVDYFFDVANEKTGSDYKVKIVQPIERGNLRKFFEEQEFLYTLYLRGFAKGQPLIEKRIISAVNGYINPYTEFASYLDEARNPDLRYIISNTTEAGIVYDGSCAYSDRPQNSFPAKLARFLHERWKVLGGQKGKGLVILSCELIDDNGQKLREHVIKHTSDWNLEQAFLNWLNSECLFCSTLVDRIVTGYPAAEADQLNLENGYIDNLMVTGEIFALWVIEGPQWLADELPFARAGLPVKVVADHSPFKKQKVRILNGAHTSMVPIAYLSGQNIVRDSMYDPDISRFFKKAVREEIIPVVPLDKSDLELFAASVEDRFKNPFIDHLLLAIALNSSSKWRARVLPSLKEYTERYQKLPPCLTFSLAAMIEFLSRVRDDQGKYLGIRDKDNYEISDDQFVLDLFLANQAADAAGLCHLVLADRRIWGEDLTDMAGLETSVSAYLADIRAFGMRAALKKIL